MSRVYLIRHGQAGSRSHYDELSPLGRRQARLLGERLAREGVRFEAIWSGGLARQRQTAEEVWCAYRTAGIAAPEIVVDPAWNEFDLDAVFEAMAPRLAAVDENFRREYEELQRQVADPRHPIHHSWSPCDMACVMAWLEGRFEAGIESWDQFRARVLSAAAPFTQPDGRRVAVFTSATPIAVWIGQALGMNGNLMKLAGVMYNSAVSVMRVHEGEPMLFSFNGIEHLERPELRTFR